MPPDLYLKLGERLNQNVMKFPLGEPVLAFLQTIYTDEEAAIGAGFPVGSHTLAELAGVFAREPEALLALLETMADKGLVFVHTNAVGKASYSLTPFVPGIVELQTMRGTETRRDIQVAHALKKMFDYLDAIGHELFKDPDTANKLFPAAMRTLTVEKELPRDAAVLPFEQVSAMLNAEHSFTAGYCHCRQVKKLTGSPCQVQHLPERSCIYFGTVADFMVERKFARRIAKEECFRILQQSEDAGLVHTINNYLGRTLVVCNCCSCCCDFLTRMKKYRGLKMVAPSNFRVTVETENCTRCGSCIARCQMEALRLENDGVSLTDAYCIGCGNCVSVCPADALKMVRHSDVKPVERAFAFPGLGV